MFCVIPLCPLPHNFDDTFLRINLYWYPIICIRHNYWTSPTFSKPQIVKKKFMAFFRKIFWKLSCETSEQMLLQIFAHWPVTITSINDCSERDNYKNDGISRPRVMNIWLFFPSICFNRKNRNHEVKDKYFPRRTHKRKSLSLKFSYFLGKHFS